MILRYLFYGLLIYMAYKLIVGFIIPVYRTTKQVKKQFREAQNRMQEQYANNNLHEESTNQYKSTPEAGKAKVGDYIDFEEVND